MNITFLIGNGFDLNCGLKSSYHDIYLEYIKQPSSSDVIAKFKKDLWDKIDNWGDFEVAMADYMKNFKTENDFLECLRDFVAYLEKYLTDEEKQYTDISSDRIRSVIIKELNKSLTEFHKGVTHDLDRLHVQDANIFAVVFNYTKVFDTFQGLESSTNTPVKIKDVIHIHGRLNDDVIMGMDNASQIKDLQFSLSMKGRRAFIKSVMNQYYDTIRLNNAIKYISNSDVICVFGMSLGESDLRWRNLIIDTLVKKDNAHLFLYDHKCSCLSSMGAEHRIDVEEERKKEKLNAWHIKENDMSLVFDKVHIPCCKNIFNFSDVITKEKLMIIAEERALKEKAPRFVYPTNLNR